MQLQAKHHHSMQISWLVSAVLLLLLVYAAISLCREELNSFPELSDAGILLLNNRDIPLVSIDKKKPLMLSTEHYQRPANFVDAQAYMQDTLKNQFNWQVFTLKEGAGLSRDNRLSAEQLVELLNRFRAWKHLLPEVTAGLYAKSGTLNKVSTLAGYTIDKQHHWNAFALMMTQSVPSRRRNFIIRKLADR